MKPIHLRPRHALAAAFVAAALSAGAGAHAATITTATDSSDAGTDTGGDTYVNKGDNATNFGGGAHVIIKNAAAGGSHATDRLGLLKFDIADAPTLATPASAADVTLTLQNMSSNSTDFRVYGIPDGAAEENFDESALTFNSLDYTSTTNNGSFDATGASGSGDDLINLADASVSSSAKVDVSSTALSSFINNDTNGLASFLLFSTDDDDHVSFASKENTTANVTVSTLTIVPEPASLILLAGGALLVLPRRTRRRPQR